MDALSLMFQNGLKNQAAYSLPQQLQVEQQMAQAKLREQQMANDQSAVMNPLNAQFAQGRINQQGADLTNTQAALPGIVGDSQSKASAGATEEATTGAKIAQRLSSLSNQIGVDGMQNMKRQGDILGQAAAALAQYPPALHKQVLPKLIEQYGGDPNSQLVQGILSGSDTDVKTRAAGVSQGMIMASGDYLQKQALQNNENKSQEKIASGHDATSIQVAKINAAAKEAAAKVRASATKFMSSDQAIAFLEMQPDRTPEEEAQLRNLKTQKLQERAAGANATPAAVLNLPTPLQNAAAAGQGGAPAPTPAPVNASSPIEAALKQQNLPFEPDKYDYRMGPNGQVQRKAK